MTIPSRPRSPRGAEKADLPPQQPEARNASANDRLRDKAEKVEQVAGAADAGKVQSAAVPLNELSVKVIDEAHIVDLGEMLKGLVISTQEKLAAELLVQLSPSVRERVYRKLEKKDAEIADTLKECHIKEQKRLFDIVRRSGSSKKMVLFLLTLSTHELPQVISPGARGLMDVLSFRDRIVGLQESIFHKHDGPSFLKSLAEDMKPAEFRALLDALQEKNSDLPESNFIRKFWEAEREFFSVFRENDFQKACRATISLSLRSALHIASTTTFSSQAAKDDFVKKLQRVDRLAAHFITTDNSLYNENSSMQLNEKERGELTALVKQEMMARSCEPKALEHYEKVVACLEKPVAEKIVLLLGDESALGRDVQLFDPQLESLCLDVRYMMAQEIPYALSRAVTLNPALLTAVFKEVEAIGPKEKQQVAALTQQIAALQSVIQENDLAKIVDFFSGLAIDTSDALHILKDLQKRYPGLNAANIRRAVAFFEKVGFITAPQHKLPQALQHYRALDKEEQELVVKLIDKSGPEKLQQTLHALNGLQNGNRLQFMAAVLKLGREASAELVDTIPAAQGKQYKEYMQAVALVYAIEKRKTHPGEALSTAATFWPELLQALLQQIEVIKPALKQDIEELQKHIGVLTAALQSENIEKICEVCAENVLSPIGISQLINDMQIKYPDIPKRFIGKVRPLLNNVASIQDLAGESVQAASAEDLQEALLLLSTMNRQDRACGLMLLTLDQKNFFAPALILLDSLQSENIPAFVTAQLALAPPLLERIRTALPPELNDRNNDYTSFAAVARAIRAKDRDKIAELIGFAAGFSGDFIVFIDWMKTVETDAAVLALVEECRIRGVVLALYIEEEDEDDEEKVVDEEARYHACRAQLTNVSPAALDRACADMRQDNDENLPTWLKFIGQIKTFAADEQKLKTAIAKADFGTIASSHCLYKWTIFSECVALAQTPPLVKEIQKHIEALEALAKEDEKPLEEQSVETIRKEQQAMTAYVVRISSVMERDKAQQFLDAWNSLSPHSAVAIQHDFLKESMLLEGFIKAKDIDGIVNVLRKSLYGSSTLAKNVFAMCRDLPLEMKCAIGWAMYEQSSTLYEAGVQTLNQHFGEWRDVERHDESCVEVRKEIEAVQRSLHVLEEVRQSARELAKFLTGEPERALYRFEIDKQRHKLKDYKLKLLNEYDVNVRLKLTPDHFARSFLDITVPPRPSSGTLNTLIAVFDATDFEEAGVTDELQRLVETSDRGQLKAMLQGLIATLNAEQAKERTKPQNQQHNTAVATLLLSILEKLPSQDNRVRAQALVSILYASQYCITRKLFECFNVYQKVVLGKPITFDSQLMTALGRYRELLYQSGVPPLQQSIHLYDSLVHYAGKKLGIPGSGIYSELEDPYPALSRELLKEDHVQLFLASYKPSEILVCVKKAIKENEDFRGGFFKWAYAMYSVPNEWGVARPEIQAYEKVRQELQAQLKTGQDRKAILRFLQRHPEAPLQPEEHESYEQAIDRAKENERKTLYYNETLFDDVNRWQVKEGVLERIMTDKRMLETSYG